MTGTEELLILSRRDRPPRPSFDREGMGWPWPAVPNLNRAAVSDDQTATSSKRERARMSHKPVNLESLAREGRNLLSNSHPVDAHRDFLSWADKVAEWLDDRFPGSGFSADWSGLPTSMLVTSSGYDSSFAGRDRFNKAVGHRLQWLGALGKEITKRAETAEPDTQESDAVFAAIADLVTTSSLPQQFKNAVGGDLAEARKAYRARAYKGCVVMLGAALEGLMLGTLQRSDVITHLATAASVPKPIKTLGTRDPALSDKIGDKLSFEDFKVCIHEMIPGSDDLGVDNIQDFRNAIHPWKSIQEPLKYGSFDQSRALHYLASLHQIVQALHAWKP
jgi:hypothetical protein